MRPGPETFLLQLDNGDIVLADLDVKSEWDAVNLYYRNSEGLGWPNVWAGDDGGEERPVIAVYEYADGELFADTYPLFRPYDMETFIRRVIEKTNKYHPGNEDRIERALRKLGKTTKEEP